MTVTANIKLPRKKRTKPIPHIEEPFEYVALATDRGPVRQKRYRPTQEQRDQVQVFLRAGIHQHEVAKVLGITQSTLDKHFAAELNAHSQSTPGRPVSESLFRDARSAIRFAVTCEGNPGRPLSSRMVDPTRSGRDFYQGLDAAAQAGFIMGKLGALGRLRVAVLVAGCGPSRVPCHCRRPCCSGYRIPSEWREAIDTISQEAARALPVGSKNNYGLRCMLVLKIFGVSATLRQIAEELHLDGETVARHHRAILAWLRGGRTGQKGEVTTGIELYAWAEAERILQRAGVIGE